MQVVTSATVDYVMLKIYVHILVFPETQVIYAFNFKKHKKKKLNDTHV